MSLVALLSVAGHWVVSLALAGMSSDSRVLNLAGRQRMLSQCLCKLGLELSEVTDKARWREEMGRTLRAFGKTHEGLLQGDSQRGLPDRQSPEIRAQFLELSPYHQALVANALALENETDAQAIKLYQARLLQAEDPFLQRMEAIVASYERESSAKVSRLRQLEWALLGLTMLVLLQEALLIFRPAAQKINRALNSLENARFALEERNLDLQAALVKVEDSARIKSRFLRSVSHEILDPLQGLLGASGLLLQTKLSAKQRQLAESFEESAEALTTVINDILDFSRLESGRYQLRSEPTDLLNCVEEAVDLYTPLARARGLALLLRYPPDMPRDYVCDGARVRQIVANLISNAIKYTPSGQVFVEVGASRRSKSGVTVVVEDTGVGIAPEFHRKIFERFFQLEREAPRQEAGTGLGLAIAEELAHLMGGAISLESRPAEGSRFCVELPLLAVVNSRRAAADSGSFSGKRVLIVAEQALARLVLHEQLHARGMLCRACDEGESAYELCSQALEQGEPFAAVLFDQAIPARAGDSLVKNLRVLDSSLALILLSAVGKEFAPEPGLTAVFAKPLRESELVLSLSRVFAGESSPYPGRRSFVLLLDEDRISLRIAATVFERRGARVHCVLLPLRDSSSHEVESLELNRYDLVVLLGKTSLEPIPDTIPVVHLPLGATPELAAELLQSRPARASAPSHVHMQRLAASWVQLPGTSDEEVFALMEEFSRVSGEMVAAVRTALRRDDLAGIVAGAKALRPLLSKFGATGAESLCEAIQACGQIDSALLELVDELARELCQYQLEVDLLWRGEE